MGNSLIGCVSVQQCVNLRHCIYAARYLFTAGFYIIKINKDYYAVSTIIGYNCVYNKGIRYAAIFYPILTKGSNTSCLPNCFPAGQWAPKRESTLNEKNLLLEEQILFLKS